jgi:alanine racemase
MTPERRAFLARLAALPAAISVGAAARGAPPLSETNFGLSHARATHGNAWLEIDAAGFERNIAELRKLLDPATQICAVLKADAYGHGLDLLMPSILRAGISCIGICSNDEARIARARGFRGRIVRLRTATLEEVEDGLPRQIEELVGNADYAQDLARIAQRRGRRLRVHFALNSTGMDRNGLELGNDEGKEDARRILALAPLQIAGIMSHFPVEEAGDMRAGNARFADDTDWVIAAGKLQRKALTIHVANSYATLNVPESRLDMVRTGGVLFGDSDPAYRQFARIMTFKSRVATVNHYPAGSTVAYDRTYKLARDSWLANIPVGYSDGYRRAMSHANQPDPDKTQACVLVRGRRLPVVGRVTMNTLMVDATDMRDEIRIDDEVVLYGRQGDDEITQESLEGIARTIGPDFYTVWGNSLPKVLKPPVRPLRS